MFAHIDLIIYCKQGGNHQDPVEMHGSTCGAGQSLQRGPCGFSIADSNIHHTLESNSRCCCDPSPGPHTHCVNQMSSNLQVNALQPATDALCCNLRQMHSAQGTLAPEAIDNIPLIPKHMHRCVHTIPRLPCWKPPRPWAVLVSV
jgi:hypothetical protein